MPPSFCPFYESDGGGGSIYSADTYSPEWQLTAQSGSSLKFATKSHRVSRLPSSTRGSMVGAPPAASKTVANRVVYSPHMKVQILLSTMPAVQEAGQARHNILELMHNHEQCRDF